MSIFTEVHIVVAIISLALAALLWFVLVRVFIGYRRQGGKLPIDIQRLVNFRKWSRMSEWPQTEAYITATHICVPDRRFNQLFRPVSFPPNRIEICFEYEVSGERLGSKFSVAFVDMDWATMATQNAVGKTVKIQFDPGDPKDCVPVEKEWLGYKVWSVG